jgi:hypothetical protein
MVVRSSFRTVAEFARIREPPVRPNFCEFGYIRIMQTQTVGGMERFVLDLIHSFHLATYAVLCRLTIDRLPDGTR